MKTSLIGIKQEIKLDWMDFALNCRLSGLDAKQTRSELFKLISSSFTKGPAKSTKSEITSKEATNIIMNSWITPKKHVLEFCNHSLSAIQKDSELNRIAIHWSMLSAAYPFWFNTSSCIGRLFNFQDKVSLQQIMKRLIENYGDRETITRSGRRVIRSLVEWGLIFDCDTRGSYTQASPIPISDVNLVEIFIEMVLITTGKKNITFEEFVSLPGLFPFKIKPAAVSALQKGSPRIISRVDSYGSTYFSLRSIDQSNKLQD